MLLIHEAAVGCHACMLHAQLFNLHTNTMKLAEETFVITVFILWAFIHAQFRILVGGTGQNVLPSFHSVPGFSMSLGMQTHYIIFGRCSRMFCWNAVFPVDFQYQKIGVHGWNLWYGWCPYSVKMFILRSLFFLCKAISVFCGTSYWGTHVYICLFACLA